MALDIVTPGHDFCFDFASVSVVVIFAKKSLLILPFESFVADSRCVHLES